MLAQCGYFYIQRYSNMNRQRDLDTVPNTRSNDKPYLKASKKKKKGGVHKNAQMELFFFFFTVH